MVAFLNGEELSKVKKLLLTTIALKAIGVAVRAIVKRHHVIKNASISNAKLKHVAF